MQSKRERYVPFCLCNSSSLSLSHDFCYFPFREVVRPAFVASSAATTFASDERTKNFPKISFFSFLKNVLKHKECVRVGKNVYVCTLICTYVHMDVYTNVWMCECTYVCIYYRYLYYYINL